MTFDDPRFIPAPDGDERSEEAVTVNAGAAVVDHFVERDGERYAGAHLLLDLWGARDLCSVETIDRALRQAAEAARATVLSVDLHHFSPQEGVSGVAILAESHISIHTWPERNFAAVDIFMCGDTEPMQAVEVLRTYLQPQHMDLLEHKRGRMP